MRSRRYSAPAEWARSIAPAIRGWAATWQSVLPAAFAADPDRLRRFEQEARAAATISHPNILVVYDVGVFHPPAPSEASGFGNDARPSPYLVSELLDGETLAARLRRGPLTVRRAVEFVVR